MWQVGAGDTGLVSDPPSEQPVESTTKKSDKPKRKHTWSSRALSVTGEILMTIGVLLLLLVVYDLWWTNIIAQRAADSQVQQLTQTWQQIEADGDAPDEPEPVVTKSGESFARVYIPRLRDKVWGLPLVEGVTEEDLAKGLAHFPDSELPGELGNFAIAGHRATNGEPFAYIDRLQPGDEVIVETETGWYVYKLKRDQITTPYDAWVVDPVPGKPLDTKPTKAQITLFTCNPRWGSTERWVWWGDLVEEYHKGEKTPEAIEKHKKKEA